MRAKKKKNRRLEMRYVRRIITLHHRSGLAYRQIGKALGVPRSTVSDYIRRFKRSHLTLKDLKDKTDQEIHRILFSDELKRPRGGLNRSWISPLSIRS